MRDRGGSNEPLVIERRWLLIGLVFILLACGLLVGMLVTPYVHGQPLLLTRDNLAVKEYLDHYQARVAAAQKEHDALVELLAPSRPSANVTSVFDASQRARAAQTQLNALAAEVERTRVPSGLAALDDALRGALVAELHFADQTLTFVGRADEPSRQEALDAADAAQKQIEAARQAWQATTR